MTEGDWDDVTFVSVHLEVYGDGEKEAALVAGHYFKDNIQF